MKHRRIPGVIDLFEVDDPVEIKALANDPVIDRSFDTPSCPMNWFLVKRSLSLLSFRGNRFPTMKPRACPSRAHAQEELWRELNSQISDIKTGPVSLTPIAKWVRGTESGIPIGILAQQLLGRLFQNDFMANKETWAAALVLVAAPHSTNLPKLFWWFTTGKVRRAKNILAAQVDNDLSAVNAIGIAVHNVVKGLHYMRSLYADIAVRETLSASEAAKQCLRAPVSLYRQSTTSGKILGSYFNKNALFVLNISVASQCDDGRSLVFMDDSWSRCPAAAWVPAMFEGVWRRVCEGK